MDQGKVCWQFVKLSTYHLLCIDNKPSKCITVNKMV